VVIVIEQNDANLRLVSGINYTCSYVQTMLHGQSTSWRDSSIYSTILWKMGFDSCGDNNSLSREYNVRLNRVQIKPDGPRGGFGGNDSILAEL
jgi:hypothetical protein